MSIPQTAELNTTDDYLLCNECGTQYPVTSSSGKDECKICDDPRQYVPATGQVFTTLGELKEKGYRNVWEQDAVDERIWFARTVPKVRHRESEVVVSLTEMRLLCSSP